jgi:ribose-phosphate pyrophosphokinase
MRRKKEDNNYVINVKTPRFTDGQGKGVIDDTVRSKDVYILVDVGNYGCTYKMFGHENLVSPDEHFVDLKRALSAITNTADRTTVIMPLLYASRQHKRRSRESLDCAMALQELQFLGVNNIITFDAHDTSVQNAIPNLSFKNCYASNVIIKTLVNENILSIDRLMVISPDTGAMDRAIYYADILGVDVGTFYKRRDNSKVINGKNEVLVHQYMGKDFRNLDVIVVDDMIASGDSILDVAGDLKEKGANNIYLISTFAIFTEGTEKFQEAYKNNLFKKIYSTNLSYIPDEVKNYEWFTEVDCSEFIATIIDTLNRNESISPLLKSNKEILTLVEKKFKTNTK